MAKAPKTKKPAPKKKKDQKKKKVPYNGRTMVAKNGR
jgi:hypothetical protein